MMYAYRLPSGCYLPVTTSPRPYGAVIVHVSIKAYRASRRMVRA